MAFLNKVFLVGNLTRDPELRYTSNGTPVTNFGLAINRRWTGADGQRKEETCFVDIESFGKQAETLSQYMSKGRPLLIEGRLKYASWESQDGRRRSKLSVVVERFQFLGRSAGEDVPSPDKGKKTEPAEFSDDEIPF